MGNEESCKTCDSDDGPAKEPREEEALDQFLEHQALEERLGKIRRKLLVLSGKGGVGKSTVAANLAVTLATQGHITGLLDIDLHGPSIPKLLHLEGSGLGANGHTMFPVTVGDNLKVMSIGFLLRSPDDAVIRRGPLKMGVIKQFLRDVEWGELDYLIVDSPPGTGDEPLSMAQLLGNADGAIVVTTPQDVAVGNVRKCITFCRQLKLPVLGVIENMSGFACPHCGKTTDLFGSGGGERMAAEMGEPFLGRIPLDGAVAESGDAGQPFAYHHADAPAAKAFARITENLLQKLEDRSHAT